MQTPFNIREELLIAQFERQNDPVMQRIIKLALEALDDVEDRKKEIRRLKQALSK